MSVSEQVGGLPANCERVAPHSPRGFGGVGGRTGWPSASKHKDKILSLATDFPALWSNPDITTQRDRKRMVRLLLDDAPCTRPTASTCTSASAAGRPTA